MNATGPLEIGIGFHSMQSAYMRPRRHSYLYEEAAREARRHSEPHIAEALHVDCPIETGLERPSEEASQFFSSLDPPRGRD